MDNETGLAPLGSQPLRSCKQFWDNMKHSLSKIGSNYDLEVKRVQAIR